VNLRIGFLFGKSVKKSRGEGGERVRACRQTLSPNREPAHGLKESRMPEAQGLSSFLDPSLEIWLIPAAGYLTVWALSKENQL